MFVEVNEGMFDEVMRSLCQRLGVQFTTIDDEEQAKRLISSMKREEQGVIRISRKFARGFDLKMACAARVILVANGETICFSEVM